METVKHGVELKPRSRVYMGPYTSNAIVFLKDNDIKPMGYGVSGRRDSSEACSDDSNSTSRFRRLVRMFGRNGLEKPLNELLNENIIDIKGEMNKANGRKETNYVEFMSITERAVNIAGNVVEFSFRYGDHLEWMWTTVKSCSPSQSS